MPRDPPGTTDVVIVGSGYTGLHAAIQTARAGRQTTVIDAGAAGWGCSSRNGGHVSTSIKGTHAELSARFGARRSLALLGEGRDALEFLDQFIRGEGLDCDWQRCGRFLGVHTPARYEALARRLAERPREVRVEAHMVPRSEQRSEIGTDFYHGGAVFPTHGALHPARYHLELLRLAVDAGVTVVPGAEVVGIHHDASRFKVRTASATVTARDVVLATNGYTGPLSPWHRRRVIPIGSYMIATAPLDPALVDRLCPRRRVMSDTRNLVYYYRPSPDGRRILFGGRVALRETDTRVSAPRLRAAMSRIFPELARVAVSHSWMGFVGYTFDRLPHVGVHEGVHYALGYCGSGVSMASYLGMRIGQRVLGRRESRTAFDDLPFESRPLYTGTPWFLAPSILWYRFRDRLPR